MQVTVAFVVFQLRFKLGFVGYLTVFVPPFLDTHCTMSTRSTTSTQPTMFKHCTECSNAGAEPLRSERFNSR